MAFGALLARKRVFLASVYAILVAQIVLTSVVVAMLRARPATQAQLKKYALMWVVLAFGVLLVMGLVPMPMVAKLALFGVLGVLLGFVSIAASAKVPIETVQVALAATVAIFAFMTVAGVGLAAMGVDLGFLGFALLIALFALVVTSLLAAFVIPVSKGVHTAILGVTMALFSVFVAFDTNVMLQKGYGGDAVDAATGLYLDALNIFNADVGLSA